MFCTNPECPDLQATGSPGEYRSGISHCPVCGAPLVDAVPSEHRGHEIEDVGAEGQPGAEAVFETSDPSEVEIVKSILTGAEIPFVVEGMESFSAFRAGHAAHRFNPRAGAVVFVVPGERAEEARALLTAQEDGLEE